MSTSSTSAGEPESPTAGPRSFLESLEHPDPPVRQRQHCPYNKEILPEPLRFPLQRSGVQELTFRKRLKAAGGNTRAGGIALGCADVRSAQTKPYDGASILTTARRLGVSHTTPRRAAEGRRAIRFTLAHHTRNHV